MFLFCTAPTWLEFQPVGCQFHHYLRCLTSGLTEDLSGTIDDSGSSEDEDSDTLPFLDPSQWKVSNALYLTNCQLSVLYCIYYSYM